ncbi:MAG TPA: excinuclease ABC subunit UvrA [Candidatus Kapabacteria bacterium]|nr:excinuclease ABC subunit UvrA [Candidatus Kapabacteria bacterium]
MIATTKKKKSIRAELPASREALPSSKKPITIKGARVHNLKNVSLELPRNKFIVFTGVSGSGKSSLAFDTLYAEGQRRYVESLSAYARQFLERMQKPDVDMLTGISPAVAIEQKTFVRNPRSTVATQTEIYDYLRVLYARIGITYCVRCGSVVRKDTPSSVVRHLAEHLRDGDKFYILFPMHRHSKKPMEEEWKNLRAQGFFRITLAGHERILELSEEPPKTISSENVRVLVDRLVWKVGDEKLRARIVDSLEAAFREGSGTAIAAKLERDGSTAEYRFSDRFECSNCGIPYEEPEPRLFAFNSPFGACPECEGFGRAIGIDMNLVVPDRSKTLRQGAIACWTGSKFSSFLHDLERIAKEAGVRMDVPYATLTDEEQKTVWEGFSPGYKGLSGFFHELETQTYKLHYRVILSRYRGYTTCPACHGSRLRPAALNVKVANNTIFDVVKMTISEAREHFNKLVLSEYEKTIAERVVDEITKRLRYLDDVGLGYLTLHRLSNTLSGGESQRIQLASSLGGALTSTLYVLDEPSIGLHQRDSERLLGILKRVRDLGNTVIVVEHDEDIIRAADHIVDFGPNAGEHGGEIIFSGSLSEIEKVNPTRSLTASYLSGRKSIPIPKKRRKANPKLSVRIKEASQNNLKHIDVAFPVGVFTAVTGVSGSGKSTLVHSCLYNGLRKEKGEPVHDIGAFASIEGAEYVGEVVMIDQTPIGKTPRSNPATYVNAFDHIREAFSRTLYAKQRDLQSGYFSFNIPGGRCETCQGEGFVKVEMQFLADMYLLCETCGGSRYKAEALEATIKNKNIVDVLNMTISEALKFFADNKRIVSRLQTLEDVGLGYMKLGQPANTLSGGEAQRIKLATYLAERDKDNTLFIFDEPTTGLHLDDIAKLLTALNALVDAGNSVIIIEHNLEVVKCADWVIDLGPEAGEAGGDIVAVGTPEQIASAKNSYTGAFLKRLVNA